MFSSSAFVVLLVTLLIITVEFFSMPSLVFHHQHDYSTAVNAQSSYNHCPASSETTTCSTCLRYCQAWAPSYVCRTPFDVSSTDPDYRGRANYLCASTLGECQRLCFAPEYCLPTNYALTKPPFVQNQVCALKPEGGAAFNLCPRHDHHYLFKSSVTTCAVCRRCLLHRVVNNTSTSSNSSSEVNTAYGPYYFCPEISTCYREKPDFSHTDFLRHKCFGIPNSNAHDACADNDNMTTWEDYHNHANQQPPAAASDGDNSSSFDFSKIDIIWIVLVVAIVIAVAGCIFFIRRDRATTTTKRTGADDELGTTMMARSEPTGDEELADESLTTKSIPRRAPRELRPPPASSSASKKVVPVTPRLRSRPTRAPPLVASVPPAPHRREINTSKSRKKDLEDEELAEIARRVAERRILDHSVDDVDDGSLLHAAESFDAPVEVPADMPFGSPRDGDDNDDDF